MNIKDYRRRLEQELAVERANAEEPKWDEGLEAAGALEKIGPPTGNDSDTERLRAVLADREADVELRTAALGALVLRQEDSDNAQNVPLEELQDETEDATVRLAALQILKVLKFQSPTASDWHATFVTALRSAAESEDALLCNAAFKSLASMKDRVAQEVLLKGLGSPDEARVAPEAALRYLSLDPHSGVQAEARKLADDTPDEEVRLEALRVLASDSGSVERFRSVLADRAEKPAVRKLCATALVSLAPDILRAECERLESADLRTSLPPQADSSPAAASDEDQVLMHTRALLEGLA